MQHLSSKQTSPSTTADLWRIVGCLTPEQTRRFSREIKLLASATFPEESPVQPRTRAAEGVRVRHSQWCPGRRNAACGCSPRWEAWVYSRKDRAKIRKTFAERWEAKAWRHRQLELASVERLHAPSHHTFGETASLWVKMAQEGQIRNRSGRRYNCTIAWREYWRTQHAFLALASQKDGITFKVLKNRWRRQRRPGVRIPPFRSRRALARRPPTRRTTRSQQAPTNLHSSMRAAPSLVGARSCAEADREVESTPRSAAHRRSCRRRRA
jgi:hypothetical protein